MLSKITKWQIMISVGDDKSSGRVWCVTLHACSAGLQIAYLRLNLGGLERVHNAQAGWTMEAPADYMGIIRMTNASFLVSPPYLQVVMRMYVSA